MKDLQEILDDWCSTSGEKFNVPKTVIVPVEIKDFCRNLIEIRRPS